MNCYNVLFVILWMMAWLNPFGWHPMAKGAEFTVTDRRVGDLEIKVTDLTRKIDTVITRLDSIEAKLSLRESVTPTATGKPKRIQTADGRWWDATECVECNANLPKAVSSSDCPCVTTQGGCPCATVPTATYSYPSRYATTRQYYGSYPILPDDTNNVPSAGTCATGTCGASTPRGFSGGCGIFGRFGARLRGVFGCGG